MLQIKPYIFRILSALLSSSHTVAEKVEGGQVRLGGWAPIGELDGVEGARLVGRRPSRNAPASGPLGLSRWSSARANASLPQRLSAPATRNGEWPEASQPRLIRRPACSLGALDQARQHRRRRRGADAVARHQHQLQHGRVPRAPQRQQSPPPTVRWPRC